MAATKYGAAVDLKSTIAESVVDAKNAGVENHEIERILREELRDVERSVTLQDLFGGSE